MACEQTLHKEEQPWHVHHRRWRCFGGLDTFDNLVLLHANCHRQVHTSDSLTDQAASCEGRCGRLEPDEA